MKILEIKELVRKDVPIYYRRLFSGIVIMELLNKSVERHIDFSIETKPTGHKEIVITIAEPVDYPMVPLLRALKTFIDTIDKKGELPG
ncbi:MAG: hypothetical protein LBT14_03465 [Treponema sp.]|jgi:hypothetical protein|nr:hypothetical protein [Treponema sp.]